MTSEIECFHRYLNSASRTSRYPLNKHCRARPCRWPQPYDPDFGLSMPHLFGICQISLWHIPNRFDMERPKSGSWGRGHWHGRALQCLLRFSTHAINYLLNGGLEHDHKNINWQISPEADSERSIILGVLLPRKRYGTFVAYWWMICPYLFQVKRFFRIPQYNSH